MKTHNSGGKKGSVSDTDVQMESLTNSRVGRGLDGVQREGDQRREHPAFEKATVKSR